MKRVIVVGVCASLLFLSGLALAQKPSKGNGERQPPKEAITACESQPEGAAVSFTTPRGDTLSATCTLLDEQLVAVPEGHKGRGGKGRPDEAAQGD
ncbi:hypothetical protein R50072_20950 [Simiduia litorea]|uniref:hypothetical protein n=1 Tax=Simiduia litorea TaxID=1435348 RepID=UPI0036F3277F